MGHRFGANEAGMAASDMGRFVGVDAPDVEGITVWARAGAPGVEGVTVEARDETPDVEAVASEMGGV